MKIGNPMTNQNDTVEEVRQMLYRAADKFVINQRAVDAEKITPQQRDEMNMKVFDGIIDKVSSTLTEERKRLREKIEGMIIKKPKCDCRTYTMSPHNCDFTSNEAIEDALQTLQ